ncbi:MAG: hypothetical protein Kow0062_07520 [Acidobacteriota bacterium]
MTKRQRTVRGSHDPLASLFVIDRLEIGPPRVEPARVVTPYQVVRGQAVDSLQLVYRYEEDVFDPDDPADVNLAAMATAQVALNYGLFAREIVFRGPFDEHDRKLLRAMASNTAREIFVVKLLQPNPFLVGDVAQLQPVRRKEYLLADLQFPDPPPGSVAGSWRVDRTVPAVLSSGGKESLLSFGLLDEIGQDVHSIFVNESGRHWFTAINAYRAFSAGVPNTGRVWTNSDRVFAWMLRHLPFVRQDFASMRSDEYPIRLWTVAVFVFGALPLMKKHGIGRLVIGDEFDTTVRASYRGIPHYNGLFDQSRHFDYALSRYYRAKRWSVSQFSLLRSLSELLVEKVLVERYPKLQEHQTSCHATHKDGDRMRPCGRCEKCRRVVGMLLALGADPQRCGYTSEQIERCVEALRKHGVHQERAGAEQLAFLLQGRGLLPDGRLGPVRALEHPEVMKLRFDRVRSPVRDIPIELREPLLRILLRHAAGALRRDRSRWVEWDPLADKELLVPYPFETARPPVNTGSGGAAGSASGGGSEKRGYLLGELTWTAARRRLREVDVALLPVGSIEQHGPHLPLDTDAWDAEFLAREVARSCSDPKPLVLPGIPYGVAYHHEDFAGTISIGPETLARLVHEIGLELARQGIRKLIIINGHGGNAPALKYAAQMINRDAHIFTTVDTGESSDADIEAFVDTPGDAHAGEIETSTALATRPQLVDMSAARRFVPKFSSRYLDFSSHKSVEWFARTARISRTGVLGDPTKASVEKGRRIWEIMIRNLVDLVEHLKPMTLDEIYERRY